MQKPKGMRLKKPKKHYVILHHGQPVGESWAVSPIKAINNYWWKEIKQEDEYSERYYDPAEFDAAEIK